MPSWKPRVEVDTARQQRQLDQLGVARPGPTSYGPLDGHIRLHDGTNDTGYLNFDGFQVRFRGALAGLTPHLEANATKNEQQDGRLTGHDNDVTRIDAKNTAQDGRLDGHDSTLSSHDTRITNEVAARKSADNTLHGRVNTEATLRKDADAALSGRVSTAKRRADSAHDRIDGLNFATPGELSALRDRVASVESHIGVIDSWLRQHTGYPSGGLNPGA